MKDTDIKRAIIYEDNHLIAINKPSGILSQGDITGDRSLIDLLKNYIKQRDNKPGNVFVGSIHRLDRPTSGAIIFSKTSKALSRMSELFRLNKINKTYLAIVEGRPQETEGRLINNLLKNNKTNIVKIVSKSKNSGKKAILDYEFVSYIEKKSLLKVKPITGRSHQIRVQLSHIGTPIIGDLKYGANFTLPKASIGLHCFSMEFMHPVSKERIVVKAKPPKIEHWNKFKTYI